MTKEQLIQLSNSELVDIVYRAMIDKDKLIKYVEYNLENERKVQKFLYENKNTKLVSKTEVNSAIRVYQDILERLKSGNY